MKTKRLKQLLMMCLLTMAGTSGVFAYSFESDGIYYLANQSAKTVSVTYETTDWNSYSGSVTIPATVTYNYITYSVTSININAFRNCTELTSVSIPSSVTSIGDYVFRGSTKLTSVTIPNSVTSIGDDAFGDCTELTSVTLSNKITSIGKSTFNGCTKLTSITIPNSVTSIGDDAFKGCTGLTSVTIPSRVTRIGNGAFNGCTGLTEMTMLGSYVSIENKAFSGCKNLKKITSCPTTPPSCDTYTFESVPTSCEVYVPKDCIETYKSASIWSRFTTYIDHTSGQIDNIKYNFYMVSGIAEVISGNYTGSVNIPAQVAKDDLTYSVTVIGNGAFQSCSGLTSVTLPSSIEAIETNAFHMCSGLKSITIPSSVKSIGDNAFYGCYNLETITVDTGNRYYNSGNGSNAIISAGGELIVGCNNTTIPNGVTSIGGYAFYNCSGLTSVTVPSSVKSIGTSAFYGCTNLVKVICLAENAPTAGNSSIFTISDDLMICVPVGSIDTYRENWQTYQDYIYGVNFSSVQIDGLYYTLNDDARTATVTYEYYNNNASKEFNYKDIDANVVIPAEVQYNSATYSVTSIDDYAFYNCSGLTSVTVPSSVKSIGTDAFNGCTNLAKVICPAENVPIAWNPSVFTISDDMMICVPVGSINTYRNNWQTYKDYIYGVNFSSVQIDGLYYTLDEDAHTAIVTYEYYNNNAKKEFNYKDIDANVVIPAEVKYNGATYSVTSIDQWTFHYCGHLTNVTIPDGITSIGSYAFSRCI